MNSVTILTRRKNFQWSAAISVDNDFQDAVVEPTLDTLIEMHLTAALETNQFEDGDRIQITASIVRAPK